MITYFLVLANLLALDKVRPEVISPHVTQESCIVAADKLNHLRTEEQRKKGLAAICVEIKGYQS